MSTDPGATVCPSLLTWSPGVAVVDGKNWSLIANDLAVGSTVTYVDATGTAISGELPGIPTITTVNDEVPVLGFLSFGIIDIPQADAGKPVWQFATYTENQTLIGYIIWVGYTVDSRPYKTQTEGFVMDYSAWISVGNFHPLKVGVCDADINCPHVTPPPTVRPIPVNSGGKYRAMTFGLLQYCTTLSDTINFKTYQYVEVGHEVGLCQDGWGINGDPGTIGCASSIVVGSPGMYVINREAQYASAISDAINGITINYITDYNYYKNMRILVRGTITGPITHYVFHYGKNSFGMPLLHLNAYTSSSPGTFQLDTTFTWEPATNNESDYPRGTSSTIGTIIDYTAWVDYNNLKTGLTTVAFANLPATCSGSPLDLATLVDIYVPSPDHRYRVMTSGITTPCDTGGTMTLEVGLVDKDKCVTTPIICFKGDTIIETDQGLIQIKNVTPKNTINGYKIKDRPSSMLTDKYMILFKKNALGYNIPDQDTYASKNHGIYIDGRVWRAKNLVDGKKIVKKEMDPIPIYNIQLENTWGRMRANNMEVETMNTKVYRAQPYAHRSTIVPGGKKLVIKGIPKVPTWNLRYMDP